MAFIVPLLFVFMLLTVPIGIALGFPSLLYMEFLSPIMNGFSAFRAFFSMIDGYTLMAIPFFILAGFMMEKIGLISRLFAFADALVGWLPGGFAFATTLSCVIFSAISGSSTATAAAMGLIAYPEMLRRGYPKWMAAGILASGGGIAMLIPPSIVLIVYGMLTETSITAMFFSGILPGILLGLSDAIVVAIVAIFFAKLPFTKFDIKKFLIATWRALPALTMPIFVLGGLYGGLFTPTEAGAASCLYAFVYGAIAKRGEFMRDLFPIARRSLNLTSMLFFLMGCVGILQFVMANTGWPQEIARAVIAYDLTPLGFLTVMFFVFLVLGMFLNATAMVMLVVPMVFPVATALGLDPIFFGIYVTINAELSVLTPPVGLNLFAIASVTKLPVSFVFRGALPFLISDGIVLWIIIFYPEIATWGARVLMTPVFQ